MEKGNDTYDDWDIVVRAAWVLAHGSLGNLYYDLFVNYGNI